MSENNVRIEHRQNACLIDVRELHNVWTYFGKQYLSELVALQVIDDIGGDTPQENHRIRYFGLGIGGNEATSAAYAAGLTTSYPAGADPNVTAGNRYNKLTPIDPIISTLERPIRRAGTTQPYSSAPSTDTWLFSTPEPHYRDINSVTFEMIIDCTVGDLIYGTLLSMPISEAGLFHSGANIHTAYNPLVAYVNFGTIILQPSSVVTFSWTVRLAS